MSEAKKRAYTLELTEEVDKEAETPEEVALQFFAEALEEHEESTRGDALNLAKAYNAEYLGGQAVVEIGSPLFIVAQSFLMGMGAAFTMDELLKERKEGAI